MKMYHPSLSEAQALVEGLPEGQTARVPVWRELPADLETPVSVYLKLRNEQPSFLLESVEKGEQLGRYSFLGFDPAAVLTAREGRVWLAGSTEGGGEAELGSGDPLVAARAILSEHRAVGANGLPRFCGGLVGFVSYEATRFFERVPQAARPGLGLPDMVLLLADTVLIFDHVKHRLLVVANAPVADGPVAGYQAAVEKIEAIVSRLQQPARDDTVPPRRPASDMRPWASNVAQPTFERAVLTAKEYIGAGDIFQVVLSQRLSRRTCAEPFAIYRALRMLNPSPYMFYLELPEGLRLIGSSPEMLARLDGCCAQVRPIAGTRPRGANPAEDEALARELLDDPKERAEHVMLVDLGRNDLGRVCCYGTVHVPEMMKVERYSHVMHIVSGVQGELRPELDGFDLLRATFPAGTVSGAPKVRAMEIIAALEGERRGPYAGAVGYFSTSGNMDTCITIRTIVMQGDTVHIQAGAGIVADSHPAREYQETLHKAQALAQAVEVAERGAR
jgi:anthranilate synthase component 1